MNDLVSYTETDLVISESVIEAVQRLLVINENSKSYRHTFWFVEESLELTIKEWAKDYLCGRYDVRHGHIWCDRDKDAVMIRLAYGDMLRQTSLDAD